MAADWDRNVWILFSFGLCTVIERSKGVMLGLMVMVKRICGLGGGKWDVGSEHLGLFSYELMKLKLSWKNVLNSSSESMLR